MSWAGTSHIYSKASDMSKAAMCECPQIDHSLPNYKFVFQWCAKFPGVNLIDQETYGNYSDTTPSIRFHIYHLILYCTSHGKIPLVDEKISACVKNILLHKNPQTYTLENR